MLFRSTWQWRGSVPPDSCVRVGVVRFVVPEAPGNLRLDLTVEHDTVAVTNRYDGVITPRDGAHHVRSD